MASHKNVSRPAKRDGKSLDAEVVELFKFTIHVLQDCIKVLAKEQLILMHTEYTIRDLKDLLRGLNSRVSRRK